MERFTESLRSAIERPITINDQSMVVGASFGFAIYPRDAKDATKLLRLADQRMYHLKRRSSRPAEIAGRDGGRAQPAVSLGHFVTRIGLRVVLPMVAGGIVCHPRAYAKMTVLFA